MQNPQFQDRRSWKPQVSAVEQDHEREFCITFLVSHWPLAVCRVPIEHLVDAVGTDIRAHRYVSPDSKITRAIRVLDPRWRYRGMVTSQVSFGAGPTFEDLLKTCNRLSEILVLFDEVA